MQSLNHLVAAGKVLYLGISDTPAWVVSKANEYARNNNLRQFSVYQGNWNASKRDFERDIIPMCRTENMGIVPWGVLGGGAFKTEQQRQASSNQGRSTVPTETQVAVSKALESVAERKSTTLMNVALAYVMSKAPYVFPIVGCRTLEHIEKNIEALSVRLSDADIQEIEDASPLDPGFPNSFLYGTALPDHTNKVWIANMGGTMDYVPEPKPLNRE